MSVRTLLPLLLVLRMLPGCVRGEQGVSLPTSGASAVAGGAADGQATPPHPDPDPASDPSSPPIASSSPAPPPPLRRIEATGVTLLELPLDDPGFDPALLALPGATRQSSPAPLVVATHGAEDDAIAFCAVITRAVQGRAFVLCPRGKRVDRRVPREEARYFYENHLRLGDELDQAVRAATTAFGERLDAARAVYLGYSQGAMMGALLLAGRGRQFPRVVAVEGVYGSGRWTVDMGARFRRTGGERVLFVCGGSPCAEKARSSALALGEGSGAIATRVVQGPGGHTYDGPMADTLTRELPWIFGGDPRFADP